MSTNPSPRLRLGVLAIVIVSLFSVMFARLWYLQVLAAPAAQKSAELNRVRFVTEPAPRGRILDRLGRVLVDNRVSNVVTVSRALIKDRDQVLGRLAALLGKTRAELDWRLADQRYSPFRPVPVAEDISKDVVVYAREHQELFPGVEATQVAEREYPNGTLAAHLLGYVGEINDTELKDRKGRGYHLGDVIGKTGAEQVYEDALRGSPGLLKLEVDSRGKVLRTLGEQQPVQGDDVYLTVDLDVQKLAEESLQMALDVAHKVYDKSSGKNFEAPGGAVVVMDPRDGSILALASNPTYDPAKFINGIKPSDFAALQNPASNFPLNDRAIQGLYAPGSTFKLATATAALKSGMITPNFTVDDTGTFTLKSCRGTRCSFHNAGGHAYGPVALPKAITVSSDVYFYTLGADFWSRRSTYGDAIQATGRELGLGVRSGVPLPGEAAGRVADPDTRKRVHDANPKAFPEGRWFAGDNVNMAIGQGETVVTPLQLAEAYATFANGGTVYRPRIASAVKDRDGRVTRPVPPVVERRVDLPAPVRDPIMAGLVGAVADPRGTANGAFAGFPLDRFRVAGKTGTAQVFGKQDTALFTCLAPASAPEYVISVVLEEAGFGGEAAAPVGRRILEGIAGLAPGPITRAAGVD